MLILRNLPRKQRHRRSDRSAHRQKLSAFVKIRGIPIILIRGIAGRIIEIIRYRVFGAYADTGHLRVYQLCHVKGCHLEDTARSVIFGVLRKVESAYSVVKLVTADKHGKLYAPYFLSVSVIASSEREKYSSIIFSSVIFLSLSPRRSSDVPKSLNCSPSTLIYNKIGQKVTLFQNYYTIIVI